MKDLKDIYGREWILENGVPIVESYYGNITVRQLHYRLVAIGMINDDKHYSRVKSAMGVARWNGLLDMGAFLDRERSMSGSTSAEEIDVDEQIESGKRQVKAWINSYHLNRWSNQNYFIEVWIEKKALQGVFENPCFMADVALAPCKGYPSLTFLNDAKRRFMEAMDRGQEIVILYFGDYDPSGEDIPRSIKENLARMGVDVEVRRMALNPEQIAEMGLPGVPPKKTDSRTANWDGDSVVELDAVEPKVLAQMAKDAIEEYFDEGLYDELKAKEREEREVYRQALKEFVKDLGDEEA